MLELPDDFYPTDMHWIPRGGAGAPGTFATVTPTDFKTLVVAGFKTLVVAGKKAAAGGSDLFLLTSATGRLQLVQSKFPL